MKSAIKLFLIYLFLSGCASKQLADSPLITVNSDLFPEKISRAEYYEQLGVSYSQEMQSQKAIDHFRLSILHNAKRISAHLALSDEYRKAKFDNLAFYELNEVLKLDPKNKLALKKQADLYLGENIYPKARQVLNEVLLIDDKDDEARWSIFYICKIEKKFKEAQNTLDTIVETDLNKGQLAYEKALLSKVFKKPNDYQKYLNLAYSYDPHNKNIVLEMTENLFKQNNYNQAVTVLDAYTQTHDFDLDISENLSFAAVRAEHYDLAEREYDKQMHWTKDINQLDLKKGHVFFLMGALDQAELQYLKVLKNKNSDEALFYLGQLYESQNKKEEVNTILEKISSNSDYYADAQVQLALFEKKNGDSDEAINRILVAHKTRPDQLAIYKAYADFLIDSKKYVECVALLEKGIGFFPNDEDLRVKMAFTHYRLNNHRAFKKQIAKALQINPNSAAIYSVLSELWYLKNKSSKDVQFFAQRALQLNTQNKNIKPLVAWALMDQNQAAEAVAMFEEFYEQNPSEQFYAQALSQVYSWADVVTKAQKFGQLAHSLQTSSRLKSSLIFDSRSETIESVRSNSSPVRLPASLENH